MIDLITSEGKIQQAGTSEEIYETPATESVARFIGCCNVLPGTLMRSGQVDVGGVLIAADDLALGVSVGHDVALSVRPHSIVLEPIECPTTDVRMNCFIAEVKHHDYFGEFREYRVRVENSDVRFSVVTSPNVRHAVGDQMYLSIPKEHCRVVPLSVPTGSNSPALAA